MRLTKKVFTDLTIFMLLLGVVVGITFPFFLVLLNVPRNLIFRLSFFLACVAAGMLLAGLNIALARRTVGTRIRLLSRKMKHVEGILADMGGDSCARCTPDHCSISVDSEDELGESAESFNRLIQTLSEVLQDQSDLQRLSEMLTAHLDLDTLADETLRSLIRLTGSSGGAILVEGGGELSVCASLAIQNPQALDKNPLIVQAVRQRERYMIQFPEGIALNGLIADFSPRELILEPLIYRQVLLGVLMLASSAPFAIKATERLRSYGPILAMAFHNAITHQQMQRLAALDSLTGIYNRRFGFNRIQEELSRAVRTNTALSLIMLDIDHFKVINDTYGHLVGDKIILSIVRTISQAVREGDVLIRYGGEEFLCVLPGAGQYDANLVAERIRIMISDTVVRNEEQEIRVTVSLGVASCPNDRIADVQQLVSFADDALYTAKNAGRNCVVCA